MKFPISSIIPLICLLCSCTEIKEYINHQPDLSCVKSAVQESMIVAYAVDMSAQALAGNAPSNVIFPGKPDSFPAASMITILLDAQHRIPFLKAQNGAILVSGLWTSPRDGVISIFLVNTSFYSGSLLVRNFGLVPIIADDSVSTTAVFFRQDINGATDTIVNISRSDPSLAPKTRWFGSAESFDTSLALRQEVRIISINRAASSTYSVIGAGQQVSVGLEDVGLTQYVLLDMNLQPGLCLQNPIGGFVLLKDMGIDDGKSVPVIGSALLQFTNTCNGKVKLTLGAGTYLGSIGKSFPLNLY